MSIKLESIVCEANRTMSGIDELANNIAEIGLISPIVLEKSGRKYKVVAGRRRFEAVKKLGWTELSTQEYRLTDKDGEQIAFCENFHRENLTLSEEVAQLKALSSKVEAKELAKKLGYSDRWLALRLNLTNLIDDWASVIDSVSVSALELIARESEERQEELFERFDGEATKEEVQKYLARTQYAIDIAVFDKAECQACPYNSNNSLLFGDIEAVCNKRECYTEKAYASIKLELQACLETKEPLYVIAETWAIRSWIVDEFIDHSVVMDYQYNENKAPNAPFNAVFIRDNLTAEYKSITPINNCHPFNKVAESKTTCCGGDGGEVTKEKSLKEQYDEKLTLLSAKRNKRAIELLREIITATDFFEERGESIPNFLAIIDAFVTIYGFQPKTYSYKIKEDLKKALSFTRTDRQKLYWESVAKHIGEKLNIILSCNLDNIKSCYAEDICDILGISWSNLFLKATLEVKEPKVLEKLKQQIEEESK